ncbi:hypothetical protein GCM10010168_90030 [Actinoplanes ianthinogenes]|uniref:Tetratricopeptide repeat protein n=2 Tax=Actinoplanes ianthinogenes TaxID=122358 RepID=A0ABN6CKR3_9ACTN|nr:hypothetical protein Aiant_62420 [Actinoplanes ianthinogenes]GGR57114.1 hypothetical protein GCM10010168_90030 [Actinoplanes ianthinogenes]
MRRLRQVTGEGGGPAQRAMATLDEAERARDAGDRATARRLGDAAVAELRSLVAAGVHEAEPGLVRGLLSQSEELRELARHAEAVAVAEEAVTLARADPARTQSLAVALATLAGRLLHAGRTADGLEVARESAALGGVRPDAALAQLLTTLAAALAGAGEHEAALAQSERVVGMRRATAAGNDRGSRIRLGQALTEHANRLVAAGRWADAIEFGAEAVAIHRGLAGEPADRLASVLTDYAIMLRRVGREHEAVAAAAEAAAITGLG